VRFTVLGKSPAWEDAGGACSGYLLEVDDDSFMIDCGSGAFAKLRERIGFEAVSEIVISHIHADHVLDLVPFAYALTRGPGAAVGSPGPLLRLPPGGIDSLRRLVAIWGSDGLIDDAFEPVEYGRGEGFDLGGVRARLHEVPQYALTHAYELTAPSGRRLVYGADCRSCVELERAAAAADVLLAEATLAEAESVPLERRGHMSAAEAGALAGRAAVDRLVLTHISDLIDPARALEQAALGFEGPIEIAAEGSSWEL
jgi:ribonuclease BN (tRNA processing enzyme)